MKEVEIKTSSGITIFFISLLLVILAVVLFISGIKIVGDNAAANSGIIFIICAFVIFLAWVLMMSGFFVLQPNEGAALVLMCAYNGTVKQAGWHWATPFFTKRKVSLRSRNPNGEKLKVNDEMGNPIEIAAVVVWHVSNTVEALFNVENYSEFVKVQSESAIRHLAGMYPYDITEDAKQISLRGSADEVSEALKKELQERVGKAGVIVEEARLSHLAYAPEIAASML
jgi:regulator of protease activity HflC (stomatin/prohibitin superfamily)